MKEYHTLTHALIVKPVGEPIYSEAATVIALDDEAGGAFVVVKQSGKVHEPGENQIQLCGEEWPSIREAIDRMMETAELTNNGK